MNSITSGLLVMLMWYLANLVSNGGVWPGVLMTEQTQALSMYAPLSFECIAVKNIMMDESVNQGMVRDAFCASVITMAVLAALIVVAAKLRQ